MAARDTRRSVFLNDESKIYDFCETIDAPRFYKALGLDLVESKTELSSIIGQTSTDYTDVVFSCLTDWRNAHGVGDGQCRELIMILRECQLKDVAGWLEKKQAETSRCLDADSVLQDLATKIDCPEYHKKLGLKLVGNVDLSNKIGPNTPPPYKDALYKCFIKFRDREGSSMESAKKLRQILTKQNLTTSVTMLDRLEPGLCDTGRCDGMETGELEAGLHCNNRATPEGSS